MKPALPSAGRAIVWEEIMDFEREDEHRIYPQKLFHDRVEVVATLSAGTQKVDNLNVIIQYPIEKPGTIIGKVLGTMDTAAEIEQITDAGIRYMSLFAQGRPGIPYQYTISSDKVYCVRITTRSEPPGANYIVADLRFDEFRRTDSFGPTYPWEPVAGDLPKRFLTFFLAGPKSVWGIYWIKEDSYTGNCKVEVHNSRFEVTTDDRFIIEFVPWFFRQEVGDPDHYDLQTAITAIRFQTTKGLDEFPDDEFLQIGKEIANGLTMLASFLVKRWVLWYGYQLRTDRSSVAFRRTTRDPGPREISIDETPINPLMIREFFASSLSLLANLRKENRDIIIPMTYFINGCDPNLPPKERFISLFLSLEQLSDSFRKEKGKNRILDSASFSRLKGAIEPIIDQAITDPEIADNIKSKLSELNRPAVRSVIESLLSNLSISCSDLVCEGGDPLRFIITRNTLLHTDSEIDPGTLFRHTARLEAVVERILLRLLGWEDLSRSPSPAMKDWLASQAQ